MSLPLPAPANQFHPSIANLLLDSYERLLGEPLLGRGPDEAERLFLAPFALVAHDTQAVPVFMYGNQTALDRFAMSWVEFTQLPSTHSAEPVNREERARLLAEVKAHGFIHNYAGVRIAKDGRRFRIEQATVWNLTDKEGVYRGQAACFARWTDL